MLQETAAELGLDDNGILIQAVSQLGISADDLIALTRLARESGTEDFHKNLLGVLKERSTSRGVGRVIAEIVPEYAEFFVQADWRVQWTIHWRGARWRRTDPRPGVVLSP